MKKSLLTLAALVLLVIPLSSSAQTTNTFNKYVTLGQTDPDVKVLQQTLNSLGYTVTTTGYGSSGNETSYYGPATTKAIQRFQCATLSICQGSPYTNGYGNFGPLTRRTLSQRYNGPTATTQPTTNPVVTYPTIPSPTPTPTNTNSRNLTITSVSGPTTIQQGQTATWTINSNANSLGVSSSRFAYSVDWGNGENMTVQSSNVISHSYPNAGSYAVRFQVYDTSTGGFGSVTSIVYLKVTGTNASPISVISPQAGQTYNVGNTLNIRWSGGMRLISITDLDHRISRTITQLPATAASDTSGSYNYVIPSDILSGFRTGTFGVSVYSSFGGSGDDIFDSSSPFTIQAQATACTSGQTWNGTACVTTATISISQINPNSAAAGAQVTISGTGFQQYDQACFSNSSGVISSCVTPSSLSSSQMSLTVPSITAATYTVKARRGDFLESNGLSFTISSPTCPTGQVWSGSMCTIVSSSQYNVKILSPNGGEQYTQGQTVPISFSTNLSSQQAPNGFNIILYYGGDSTNAGTFSQGVQTIAFRYTGGSPYNWSIPTSLSTGNYLAYIVPDQLASGIPNTGLFDFGDNYFTVKAASVAQPTVTVTAPNGGTFQAGSTLNIQWTATGLTQQNNSLGLAVYQTSLGSTRNILSTTVGNPVSNGQVSSSGSYNWTIPTTAPSGTDYIVYLSNSSTYTQSSPFRIIPQNIIPTITVTSPNGGESMLVGQTYPIRWNATNFGRSIGYILLRSSNPGNSRDYVVNYDGSSITYADDSGTGQYSWTLPSDLPEGTQYKIVVGGTPTNSGNADSSDISDSYFSIYRP